MSKSTASRVSLSVARALETEGARIHFIGILGAGMRPLAELMLARGYTVSGSDLASPERLLDPRIEFKRGHSPELASLCDLGVVSLAVPEDDPELAAMRSRGIPTVYRAELLGAVTSEFRTAVGVAGSHGKSTVTAMLAYTLAALSPTVMCGAELPTGSGLMLGGDKTIVYEACEYRDAFLATHPTVALLLNLELDHTDYFKDIEALRASFFAFASRADLTVYNADDEGLRPVTRRLEGRAVSFGVSPSADYRFEITGRGRRTRFTLTHLGVLIGEFSLSLLGDFNIYNAVAALVTASELGLSVTEPVASLSEFSGIPRRLERIGALGGISVIYDYAHHPTEISAGIRAVRASGASHITAVFRPHTYSRTAALWDDFVDALSLADRVIMLDVYAAREDAIDGIDSARLAAAIGERAVYAESAEQALYLLRQERTDRIILMGAGDLSELINSILKNS